MTDSKLKIAFIGTGIMGAPIAGHIMDAGYPLTVFNRTKEKAEGLIAKGAVWADSPAAAAKDADVVFTMVGFPTDVEKIYLAGEGLLATAKDGAYLIDLTTSAPELARDIAGAAEVCGKHAFDCPVTGGEGGAIAGTLTAIVGATERDIEPVREVLETFASKICCFGGAGKGQAAKLSNQVALAGAMSTLAPKAIDGDYKPGFLVEHFLKDLGLALTVAEEKELALPGADTAFTLYDMLDAIGGGRLGTQAITLLYQEEADAVAAGLDWSLYTAAHEHDEECDCGCGHDHGHDHEGHECGCGHEHGDDHECHCGGEGRHHGDDHECCGGHGHGEGHECRCGGHHEE